MICQTPLLSLSGEPLFCGGGWRHVKSNFLAIRRPDAGDMLPVTSLHTRGSLEWDHESDLTLPGEWRSTEGAIPVPAKPQFNNPSGLAVKSVPGPLGGAVQCRGAGPRSRRTARGSIKGMHFQFDGFGCNWLETGLVQCNVYCKVLWCNEESIEAANPPTHC